MEVEVLGSWGLSGDDEAPGAGMGSEGEDGPGAPKGTGLQAPGADESAPAAPTGADAGTQLPPARDPGGVLSQGEPERQDPDRAAGSTPPDRLALGTDAAPEATDRSNDPEDGGEGPGLASPSGVGTESGDGAGTPVATVSATGTSGVSGGNTGTGTGAGSGAGTGSPVGGGNGTGHGTGTENAHGALLAHLRDHAQRCYPRAARNRRTHGVVEVSFCIDGAGRPAKETVVHTSGSPLLDRVAIDCVIRGSAPLPAPASCYTVPIRFFTR